MFSCSKGFFGQGKEVKGWKLTFPSVWRYEKPSTLGKYGDIKYGFVFPFPLKLTVSDSV